MNRKLLEALTSARHAREAVAVVTALATGSQELVRKSDSAGHLLALALSDGFRFDKSGVVKDHEPETFIHIYNPPLKLVVIGAVHIAQALAPVAHATGYDVTIIDPRTAFATAERFPAVELVPEWPDEVLPGMQLDHRTAVVVLTHDPKIDDPALGMAMRSDAFYIGVLGSRKNHAGRLERLAAAGYSRAELARLHGPIGLDIGARGAPEIAISIMAEMTRALRLGDQR